MTMISRTFTVDAHFAPAVAEKLEKLSRKAVKAGVKAPAIVATREWIRTEYVDELCLLPPILHPMIDYTVECEEIKVGNWTHVATLDHTIGQNPIVKVVPGKEIPASYRTADCTCDHCGITRQRNDTFLFTDGNTFKQVGRTCLELFFGFNPATRLDLFHSYYGMTDPDSWGMGGNGAPLYSVAYSVALALATIEKYGYVSKRTAQSAWEAGDNAETTSSRVSGFYYPNMAFKSASEVAEIHAMHTRAKELETESKDLIAWGLEYFKGQDSDYAHNMSIFLAEEVIPGKYLGYVVSLIPSHTRETVAKIEKEAVRKDNAYLGEVGKKITVEVTVKKIIPIETIYGTSFINLMTQAETGNTIVWKSSANKLDEGSSYTLTGTVKDHNARQGVNQTILTRCKGF